MPEETYVPEDDLSLVSTKDLIHELKSRHDRHLIYVESHRTAVDQELKISMNDDYVDAMGMVAIVNTFIQQVLEPSWTNMLDGDRNE